MKKQVRKEKLNGEIKFQNIRLTGEGFKGEIVTLKEALAKALDAGKGLSWLDAEVINLESGKPAFIFRGEIADLIDGARVHLSISHDAGIASAIVIVER